MTERSALPEAPREQHRQHGRDEQEPRTQLTQVLGDREAIVVRDCA
jgi:hypothetical protein